MCRPGKVKGLLIYLSTSFKLRLRFRTVRRACSRKILYCETPHNTAGQYGNPHDQAEHRRTPPSAAICRSMPQTGAGPQQHGHTARVHRRPLLRQRAHWQADLGHEATPHRSHLGSCPSDSNLDFSCIPQLNCLIESDLILAYWSLNSRTFDNVRSAVVRQMSSHYGIHGARITATRQKHAFSPLAFACG